MPPRRRLPAGAKQAEEILGSDALEVAALYDQLCIIRFLHDRPQEAGEAGAWLLAVPALQRGNR